MSGWNEAYPYKLPFARTGNWWAGDWAEMSAWCDATLGPGRWEYFNSEFRFQEEKDLMLFTLKWYDNDL